MLVHQLLWFNPDRQLGTRQQLPHWPHGRGERMGEVQLRKLRGWDKDRWVGQVKAMPPSKAFSCCFPSAGRCQPFTGKQSFGTTASWEDKGHHCSHIFLLSSFKFEYITGHRLSFGSPPSSGYVPSLLTGRAAWETEKILPLGRHCCSYLNIRVIVAILIKNPECNIM